MHIDTAGTYTLQYTATDSCGNETIEEREVIVAAPRTVLYTDGTFIINEQPEDMAGNIALHGEATHVYYAFDPNGSTNIEKYVFSSEMERPWSSAHDQIKFVEIGEQISPTYTSYWFEEFSICESMDLSLLDTSNVIRMYRMFFGCSILTELDLSGFNTSAVQNMVQMFMNCFQLSTIYASNTFDTTQASSSTGMFRNDSSLVGGSGTVYSSANQDKTYARIDNPPDAPGYFTARP